MSFINPTNIKLHIQSRLLEISYSDGNVFHLSCEYLRVMSPSADVKGHGPGQEVLQVGKENVTIINIEPVGSYAVQFIFDDGHNTGIFSWEYLYQLGIDEDKNWRNYLAALEREGHQRCAPNDVE